MSDNNLSTKASDIYDAIKKIIGEKYTFLEGNEIIEVMVCFILDMTTACYEPEDWEQFLDELFINMKKALKYHPKYKKPPSDS